MKIFVKCFGLVAIMSSLAACEGRTGDSNQVTDGGIDGGFLRDGVANIWVDPDGCQHWYIDDGLEGYMTPRLNRDGTPRCTTPETTRGALVAKDGTRIAVEPEPRL